MSTPEIISALPAAFLGVGLAASSGLRAFLPLLLACLAAKIGLFGLNLTGNFAWLASDTALIALSIASVVEIAGDKIPVVDHALDAVGTVLRPGAGALVAAAVWNQNDPATAALMGVMFGAPLALGLHAAKAGTRGASTLTTAGMGNPVLSVAEDFAALLLGLVAFLAPLLIPVLLVAIAYYGWKAIRFARRLRAKSATEN
jgi:hypothetical protein